MIDANICPGCKKVFRNEFGLACHLRQGSACSNEDFIHILSVTQRLKKIESLAKEITKKIAFMKNHKVCNYQLSKSYPNEDIQTLYRELSKDIKSIANYAKE